MTGVTETEKVKMEGQVPNTDLSASTFLFSFDARREHW